LKELKELKGMHFQDQSQMRETEESGMNSIVISDLNDEGRSLGKTSNGNSTNNGKTRVEALSFMEKELKANEINLMEE
jgi:hypothetical protein